MSVGLVSSGLSDRFTRIFEEHSDKLVGDVEKNSQFSFLQHFFLSKQAIGQAIQGLENTALILGAGAAHDLPLKEFAKRFTHIVLVDIDLRHTKTALNKLPPEQKKKFSLERADLTGVFSEFGQEAEKIAQQRLPYDAFVSAILDLPPKLKREEFDYQKIRPSFVCSSLVSSQIPVYMALYLNQLSLDFYEQPFTVPHKREEEYNRWLVQLEIKHIDELHRLVAPEGKVYFADHFSIRGRVQVSSSIETRDIILGEEEIPGAKKVQEYMMKLFASIDKRQW